MRVVDNLESGDVEHLAEVVSQVEFVEGDLREPSVCRRVTTDMDTVINLAARAYGIGYGRTHQGEYLVRNLMVGVGLLEAAAENGVRRYLIVSSSCVYPDDCPIPTPELDVFTRKPELANEGYGWAKRMQELAGMYYARESDMKVVIVRPFNFYGANYRWRSAEKAHVVPSLVKRVLDGEDPLVVWGSGRQRRNLLHGSDGTRAMLLVMEKEFVGEPVNVGTEDEIDMSGLVSLICSLSGRSPEVIFDLSKPEGRVRKCADSRLLRKTIGDFRPQISLEEGIAEMLEWYKRNFENRAGRGASEPPTGQSLHRSA